MSIDSIQETTLLDKRATIAIGNLLKNHDILEVIVKDSKELIKSLWEQVEAQDRAQDVLLFDVIKPLEAKNFQMSIEISALEEKLEIQEKLHKVRIKGLKKKTIKLVAISVGVGAILAILVISR